jgi:hypothetical protein
MRALRSGLLWCIAGLVLGFLYIAEYAHDGESLFVRSRMGLGLGALCGFLGFVLRLLLPTEKEREEDQGGGV